MNVETLDKTIQVLQDHITRVEKTNLVTFYLDEISHINRLYKDIYTGLSEKSRTLFNEVYSRCRQDGNLMAKSFNVACSTVAREYKYTDGVVVLKSIQESLKKITNGKALYEKTD